MHINDQRKTQPQCALLSFSNCQTSANLWGYVRRQDVFIACMAQFFTAFFGKAFSSSKTVVFCHQLFGRTFDYAVRQMLILPKWRK
jgi:hypothetical protein